MTSESVRTFNLSETLSKRDFIRMVSKASRENHESSAESSSFESNPSRTEFNRMASSCVDQELKEYIVKFRAKVSVKADQGRQKVQEVARKALLPIPEDFLLG